jgi:dTDP-4-amino-4,6-dideoxygalactose transaminase
MEKIKPFFSSIVFDIRVGYIPFVVLGSYYVYKKMLHLLSGGNKQSWKKIPFIHKKLKNEIQQMKDNNNEDDETYHNVKNIGYDNYHPFGLLEKFWIRSGFLFYLIDVTFFQILLAIFRCLASYSINDRIKLENDILVSINMFPIYSCRSGFDAILQILTTSIWSDYKSDDQPEIIMTGLNIKHMVLLPEIHGYRIKLLDIDLDTLESDLIQLKKLITPNTRILVVAQLFGVQVDLEPLAKIAKENNILIIEDCAQSLSNGYLGSSHVDFTLFSFGLSKSYTAFGGGLLRVNNIGYRIPISKLLQTYPIESQVKYLTTVIISTIKVALSCTLMAPVVNFVVRRFGFNFEMLLNKVGKEFNYHDDPIQLLAKFRKQCSTPHLSIIRDRVQQIYDMSISNEYQIEKKIQGDYLTNKLLNIKTVKVVGNKHMSRRYSYWLFPILVQNRDQLLDKLNQNGFIASKTATSFGYIGLGEEENNCFKFGKQVVYLPYSPEIPRNKIDDMVKIIKS